MKRFFLHFAALAVVAGAIGAEPARTLDKANALPLALNDAFSFRKTKTFLNDPKLFKPSLDPTVTFERQRINFGAVTGFDRSERQGQYYTFFWRATRKADLTVRLEYRQENLGAYVQAQEKFYPAAKGSLKTDFAILGDNYRIDGKVTAWRVVLIEKGTIVAFTQSFLWN